MTLTLEQGFAALSLSRTSVGPEERQSLDGAIRDDNLPLLLRVCKTIDNTVIEYLQGKSAESFSRALMQWKLDTAPTALIFAEKIQFIVPVDKTLAVFEAYSTHDTDSEFKRAVFREIRGYDKVLEKVIGGENVEVYVEYLSTVLFGKKSITLDDFTFREQLASALLLIVCWHKDLDNAYLKLLLYFIPYTLPYLDRVTGLGNPLENAIKVFIDSPNEVYAQTSGKKFLDLMHELFLEGRTLDVELDVLVHVLKCWLKKYDRPPKEIARTVYHLSYFFNPKKGEPIKTGCKLIAGLAEKTRDYFEALQVLQALSTKEQNMLTWFEKLPVGPVRDLALTLVCRGEFPEYKKRCLVDHLTRPEADELALELAVRLVPALDAKYVHKILDRLNGLIDLDSSLVLTFRLFFRNVPSVAYREIGNRILNLPRILALLEDTAFKYPMAKHPCALFIHTVRSRQFPEQERERLIQMYMSPDASTHVLTLALKLASHKEPEHIRKICDRIESKNEPIRDDIILTKEVLKVCIRHLGKDSPLLSKLRYIPEKKSPL